MFGVVGWNWEWFVVVFVYIFYGLFLIGLDVDVEVCGIEVYVGVYDVWYFDIVDVVVYGIGVVYLVFLY